MLMNVGGLTHHPMPWDEQTGDMLVEKFRVMAVGPLLTIKHFLPKLERAPGAKVVNISSGYGSISSTSLCHDSLQGMATRADTWVLRVDKSMGTCMAYRVAKAALNQGAVTMAREWEKEGRNVTMICVEPGYVPTRLRRWEGDEDMDTCIAGLMELFKNITPEDNGGFFQWDGSKLPF